ncbi:GNAT family N-acetyltransferase [Ruminococcaceae bacterium OttesenSCG-928-D13]|nr:GNAT family N-acetyltransferase [Ruminococcaceae bacterium OttesenSCG-928-D13]
MESFVSLACEKNSIPEQNCAYCSKQRDAIEKDFSLMRESPAHLLVGYWKKGTLACIMGFFFNSENGWVDCIGPFFREDWDIPDAKALFTYGKEHLKSATQYNFFFDCRNTGCARLMRELQASAQDNEYILRLCRDKYKAPRLAETVIPYSPVYRDEIIALHREAFGEIYLDAEALIASHDKGRKLFCARTERGFAGYGALQYDENGDNLTAEVFAVKRELRGRGYGWALLNTVIQYAFAHFPGNQIHLVVDKLNERAQKLYCSCGFELVTENCAYRLK